MKKKTLKYDTILLLGPQASGKTTQLGYLLEVVDAFSASVGSNHSRYHYR